MSERLPSLTARQVLAALEKAGWYVKRIHGSHHHLRHAERPGHLVVAMHPGDMPRPTVRMILRNAKISEDEFRALL